MPTNNTSPKLQVFLCSPSFFFPPLQLSPMVAMLPICSRDTVFFYFPCRFNPCMSLLGIFKIFILYKIKLSKNHYNYIFKIHIMYLNLLFYLPLEALKLPIHLMSSFSLRKQAKKKKKMVGQLKYKQYKKATCIYLVKT